MEINSTMKKYIRNSVLIFALLLLGGMANEAWAKKITYHILTKPFTVRNYNNTGDFHSNIRVEALQCTSEESTIGLPAQFKSPLATNFQYWKTATSTYDKLYDSGSGSKIITTKLYIYQCTAENSYACLSGEIENPGTTSSDADGIPDDIYVTYDYIGDNDTLNLNETTPYNVSLISSGKQKFMCYNRSRNNRVANAVAGALSGEHLASDDFVIPEEGTGNNQLGFNYGKWGPIGVFLGFKFGGQDPYNFTIVTSYAGNELHITDKITNVDNTGTIKPYAGSTLMAKVGNNSLWFDCSNNRHYKLPSGISDAGKWTAAKYAECKNTFEKATDAQRYDTWVGFYRYESPTMNTFALLPNLNASGYIIVGSKMNQGDGNSKTPTINQPNASNQYYTYFDNYDNNESGANGKKRSQPYFKLQAFSSALPINFHQIRTYTLKVKTHGSGTTLTQTMKWSDAKASEQIVKHVPDALNRKYVTFTKAYTDEGKTNEISTFADALAAGVSVIWLDYETSSNMPFDTLVAVSGTYDYRNARWYTLRVNGKAEQKNIAYHSDNTNNYFITGSTSIGSESDLHHGESEGAKTQVAFIGDPFELKIISRAACESASAIRYIGCASDAADGTTLNTDKTSSLDNIITWEIMYESTDVDNFVLRKFNTVNNPRYIGWSSSSGDKPVIYSNDSTRIRVVELEKKKYAYHIKNSSGDIAVKAIVSQDVGTMLRTWQDIPEVIRSPFLAPSYNATVTYKDKDHNVITNVPYSADGVTEGVYANIYVSYAYGSGRSSETFNVRLYNDYIYTDATANIQSQTGITGEQAGTNPYQWELNYQDPYNMTIRSLGKDQYVKVTSGSDEAAIGWDTSENASHFIVKSGALPNTYEVMIATGEGVDASTTYYNIGRPSANTVKLYSNNRYVYGNEILRFQLVGTSAHQVTYHLIDMNGNDLLKVVTRQLTNEHPEFPPEYHSPLVLKYYYHETEEHAKDNNNRTSGNISEDTEIGGRTDIYVTYDVNDLVDLKRGKLYRLRYEAGQTFHQEDGSDGVNPTPQKAFYPYVNGDCNFFIYGDEQYDIQKDAASTRTRWVWYLQSDAAGKGDPYHVKIRSYQTESYPISDSRDYNAYFATYQPKGYDQVVTTLVWPGISGEAATEYMVLGSEGQYQLVTTYGIDKNLDGDRSDEGENVRYTVNSFEQYWKTFDTIRRKLYGDSKTKENDNDSITVPSTAKAKFGSSTAKTLRDSLTTDLGWHHYEHWAYAKRWNGYNNGYSSTEGKHETKKGWEEIEHWYQTINMGQGYFDFVETTIDPVLILLDQHGWEIMRKPLPSSPDDPQKDAKYEAIRPYNSPLVKEYAFWATTKKRTGLHQYYLLSDRIGGDDFVSTDLTKLPPYDSQNVKDRRGNLNDQYVTYIVKDEYAKTYNPANKTAKPFLIEQGTKYASTSDGTTITKNDVVDMKTHILNDNIPDAEKWYVKPNWNIDYEMGYGEVTQTWRVKKDDGKWNNKNPNAYEHDEIKNWLTADYISDKDSLGYFSFSNGFDPYNIQIVPVSYSEDPSRKFMKTNATGMDLENGVMHGVYDEDPAILLGDSIPVVNPNNSVWFDSRKLSITNATWMAVQDADGNMQLMPRFDHDVRMSEFDDLIAPTDANVATTYTKLYRPEKYTYLIIDNSGKESLRYQTGGDLMPQTPDHFRSPLATNFEYYATATKTGDTYSDFDKEITESLDGAGLTDNIIYVRYDYNEEADDQKILMGNWQTMQLNTFDAKYDGGVKKGTSKPATIDGTTANKPWQWKLLETPQSQPDPYAVYLYNRSQSEGTKAINNRFAVLSHTTGGYALAEAGLGTADNYNYTYNFLNGDGGMSDSQEAAVSTEAGFTCSAGTFSGTNSQVKFNDDVEHTFTYKVYTNSGELAIRETQNNETVRNNGYVPTLPSNIKTPLLLSEQYRYYSKSDYERIVEAKPDTVGKNLSYLYGLYDDSVVVRYTPYDPLVTEYLVPNVRNATDGTVDKDIVHSNDAALDLSGNLLYNFIWHADNMMKSNGYGTAIEYDPNKPLQYTAPYEWKFEGNDPYAIKIRSVGASDNTTTKYIDRDCNLSDSPQSFMILDRYNHDYGVLATTGDSTKMLSGYGNIIATSTEPTEFIIFALATHQVIYHLMIKNVNQKVIIPYKGPNPSDVLNPQYVIKETGTTYRDLKSRDTSGGIENHIDGDLYQLGESLKAIGTRAGTTTGLFARDSIYCVDAGQISLGDVLEVPSEFNRPNVVYDFFVEGIYDAAGGNGETVNGKNEVTDMNAKYKGVNLKSGDQNKPQMGDDSELLGKTVFINIVYSFNGALETNSGSDFVTNVSQNKWYTFETRGATPSLVQYTGDLKTVSGYATHYTNDYLWSPVGDPYGFIMYNRYQYKNKNPGSSTIVMTTANAPANDEPIIMRDSTGNSGRYVYELLATSTNTPGYFRVHPVVNKKTLISDPQYYIRDDNGTLKLSLTPTEWTFGLSEDVMRPYYLAAGYVGGLTDDGKTKYELVDTDPRYTTDGAKLMAKQEIVYDDENIVPFTPGYYRLHNQPGSLGISTPRYASGYTHKIELTAGGGSTAIPMHFYEQTEYSVDDPVFNDLKDNPGDDLATYLTKTAATQGEIPLSTVTYDPASIFCFTGTTSAATMSTQGLNVVENKMTTGAGTSFTITDIGGGVVALNNSTNYLGYKIIGESKRYDLSYGNFPDESARWCMQPVQKGTTAGNGEMGLRVATHNGGDSHYYTTFCAPFDVLLTDAARDTAWVVPAGEWPTITPPATIGIMYPKKIGEYNTGGYEGNSQFIPAGTPVIIRTRSATGYVTLALPTTTPTSSVSCVFTGKYLEQELLHGSDYVYVFGLPYSGTFTVDGDFATNGRINASGQRPDKGVGFYKNVNLNREAGEFSSSWTRNNKYVLANKIYYRSPGGGGSSYARDKTRGVDFVPVIFDDEGGEDPDIKDSSDRIVGDGCVYDLQGRKVATKQQVEDDTWRQFLRPGIYIINGKKIRL